MERTVCLAGCRVAPRVADAGSFRRASGRGCRDQAFRAPESDFRVFSTVGWQTAFDLERAGDTVLVAGRRLLGRIEFGDCGQRTSAALWTSADGNDAEWHGLAENFLRVLVAHRVLGQGGVLLHSAAVVHGDGAFVFFGHSGAGKSTLCALSANRGLQVLSDELNALVPSGDGFRVERLPFAGDFGRSGGARESFPIAGLHALAQGLPHAILPLGRARAVGALSACAPFVNDDPQGGPRLLENLEHLTRATTVSTLRFGLDPSFWDTLISRS